MGNTIGRKGKIKIMKLDGQMMKFKAPATVFDVLREFPECVVLHSEAVRHIGIRAKPLPESAQLEPRHLYFIVETSLINNNSTNPRSRRPVRASSGPLGGGGGGAKARLENLLLQRRSISDIGASSSHSMNGKAHLNGGSTMSVPSSPRSSSDDGPMRLKLRITKSELAELLSHSQDRSSAQTLLDHQNLDGFSNQNKNKGKINDVESSGEIEQIWKPALGSISEACKIQNCHENRVRFGHEQDLVC